jgi:hypothetical protein
MTALLAGVMAFGSMPARADGYDDNNSVQGGRRGQDARQQGSWQGDDGYGRSGGQWDQNRSRHGRRSRNGGQMRGGQFGDRQMRGGQHGGGQCSGGQHGDRQRAGNGGGQWNQGGSRQRNHGSDPRSNGRGYDGNEY